MVIGESAFTRVHPEGSVMNLISPALELCGTRSIIHPRLLNFVFDLADLLTGRQALLFGKITRWTLAILFNLLR
jgi:hypothetical protein